MSAALRRGLLALFAALALPAGAAEPAVRIVEWGTYVVDREARRADPAPEARTLAPVAVVEGVRFTERTLAVEARPCRRFGLLFEAPGLGAAEAARLAARVSHPPMTRPDGRAMAVETWPLRAGEGGPVLVGFGFDEPWELVPGTWRLAVTLDGATLAELAFDVRLAGEPGRTSPGGCDAPVA